jgi:hypothetical protein
VRVRWKSGRLKVAFCVQNKTPRLDLSPGRLLISPPPSAAQEQLYSRLRDLGIALKSYYFGNYNSVTSRLFGAKQNAPDSKSHGTYVDQPSPKCCSRTTLLAALKWGNGSSVPCSANGARAGRSTFSAQNKTPQTRMSHGTYVDQPSPKCCSRTTVLAALKWGNGSSVPYMARTGR